MTTTAFVERAWRDPQHEETEGNTFNTLSNVTVLQYRYGVGVGCAGAGAGAGAGAVRIKVFHVCLHSGVPVLILRLHRIHDSHPERASHERILAW